MYGSIFIGKKWRLVILTDERIFNLDLSSDDWYYHDLGKGELFSSHRQMKGCGMILIEIDSHGKTEIFSFLWLSYELENCVSFVNDQFKKHTLKAKIMFFNKRMMMQRIWQNQRNKKLNKSVQIELVDAIQKNRCIKY